MNKRYVKTAAGHAEIQAKALALSRPVRNLLLLINDSQPGEVWLQQIRGLADTDLAALLDAGLIAETAAAGAGGARPARSLDGGDSSAADTVPSGFSPTDSAAATGPLQDAQQCIATADYARLYDTLTAQAKGQLGLMKGYRFTLEVERAADLAALRALARRFVQNLHEDHGPAALRQFLDALRAAG